jgi:N utilization substance protein B
MIKPPSPLAHLTPRQRAREAAFQFLFHLEQSGSASGQMVPSEIERDFELHAQHFHIREDSLDFARRLVTTVARSLPTIDGAILTQSENWKFERIGAIEKSFLRMGIAELLFFKDVPASVTLNEVIELSKFFGEEDTPTFLNGVLDPISKLPEALQGKVASE